MYKQRVRNIRMFGFMSSVAAGYYLWSVDASVGIFVACGIYGWIQRNIGAAIVVINNGVIIEGLFNAFSEAWAKVTRTSASEIKAELYNTQQHRT